MKKRLRLAVLGLSLGFISAFLATFWYDWKLLLILVLFVWGNNLGNTAKEED